MHSSTFYSGEVVEGSAPMLPAMEQPQTQWSAVYQSHQNLGDSFLDILRSPLLSPTSSSNNTVVTSTAPQLGGFTQYSVTSWDGAALTAGGADVGRLSFLGGHVENWGDSGVAATSPRTETSTDMEADDGNRYLIRGRLDEMVVSKDTYDRLKGSTEDHKTLRRLTQNREAARRSRLRKKAYVQQLENSHSKLIQLEQEVQRARQQGIFISVGNAAEHSHSLGGGTKTFDIEYAHWLDEHQRKINDLRLAVNSCLHENELQLLVDALMAHYNEVFRLKSDAVKLDAFHILSGMWITPAERCFMWLGGFRPSELLKIIASHVEPLTDTQLMGICNLQQSSQQAEDALSQGMEALQQSLTETLASGSLYPTSTSDNVSCYMNLMATAMGKLGAIENFLCQADLLRQQTLQQMNRIFTACQAARALLAMNDYFSRLRALSSLWLARPRN